MNIFPTFTLFDSSVLGIVMGWWQYMRTVRDVQSLLAHSPYHRLHSPYHRLHWFLPPYLAHLQWQEWHTEIIFRTGKQLSQSHRNLATSPWWRPWRWWRTPWWRPPPPPLWRRSTRFLLQSPCRRLSCQILKTKAVSETIRYLHNHIWIVWYILLHLFELLDNWHNFIMNSLFSFNEK